MSGNPSRNPLDEKLTPQDLQRLADLVEKDKMEDEEEREKVRQISCEFF